MDKFKELKGANMDIDLVPAKVDWKQDKCPWNEADHTNKHKCAIKDISLCKHFKGIKGPDTVICSYGEEKK